jgi:dihydropteroate synthase
MNNKIPLKTTYCRDMELLWGKRTYIMGIINITPDSFSGDGIDTNINEALKKAKSFISDGADIIDIGGESTRPGSQPIPLNEELNRVIPVIKRMAAEVIVPISIDTSKSAVASCALEAGASMINDVSGLKKDSELARVAAEADVPIILASNQRNESCQQDIITEVISDLTKSISIAKEVGIVEQNIIIDPGIGFGKNLEQNLEIVHRLTELKSLNKPILLGTSRKSLIGLVLDLPPDQRLEGTAATTAIGIANGADIVRVHDVRQMVRVCRMSDAIIRRSINGC